MPGGVNFNPDNTGVNPKGSGYSGEVRYNDSAIIASRVGFEGPDSDQFQKTSDEPISNGFRAWFVGLLSPLLGAKSSNITFLDSPVQQPDGSYVLSKPFTAGSLEKAQESAHKQYEVQKGAIQRKTGEIYIDVRATQTDDGKYIATAGGTL